MKIMDSKAEQMSEGISTEHEHAPTYARLEAFIKENGKLPPARWLYASIAQDHLAENPEYYSILKKARL